MLWDSAGNPVTLPLSVEPLPVAKVTESNEVATLLYANIADASIFPSSILVNPQMTVYALATHIAEGILARG
jgi:hypothetical protein